MINEKYPGGTAAQRKHLESKGHTVFKKGNKFIGADFEKHLAKI